LPCLAEARQGFLWFEKLENLSDFPNKIGLFCLTFKIWYNENGDSVFSFDIRKRQFLLIAVSKGAVSAGLPLFDN
jgi:hypothetical protein